jgi:predicted transcriptional regulator
MGEAKISLIELQQLVREGYGVSAIARKLGVTKGAVSKRLKALKVGIAKDVVLRAAPEIVSRELKGMDQLKRINDLINNELDYIERNIETAKGEERKGLQEARLKHVAEVRKQLGLLLNIAEALRYDEEIKEAQQFILEEINHVAPEVKDRIVKRLTEAKALRSTLGFTAGFTGSGF